MEFDRQFRPTNRKTEMLMRPTSIMRYFHLATVALALWKLHVQDLLGSKLTTSSVYILLPHPRKYPFSLSSSPSPSLSFSVIPPSRSNHLHRVSFPTFFSYYIFSFYLSSFLHLFPSVSFNHSPSLSPLTPDDSSYCRTTPQAPHIRSHAMG